MKPLRIEMNEAPTIDWSIYTRPVYKSKHWKARRLRAIARLKKRKRK